MVVFVFEPETVHFDFLILKHCPFRLNLSLGFELHTSNNNNLMTTIGRSKRKYCYEERVELPGVGAYEVLSSEFRRTRGGSFTKAPRSITQVSLTSQQKIKPRAFSLRPGPGSYSLQLTRLKQPMSFTHSKRFQTQQQQLGLPGPGSYKSQECSKQKIKWGIISRSARITFLNKANQPGPCDYLVPQVNAYKKRQPMMLIGRARREVEEIRPKDSKEKEYYTQRNKSSERQHVKGDRAWHSRKIEKQAKVVRKDEVNFPE